MSAEVDASERGSETALVVRPLPEDRRVEDARARLALARQRTRGTLTALRTELRSEFKEKIDWHTWYRARPGIFLAAAFFTGFLLGRRR